MTLLELAIGFTYGLIAFNFILAGLFYRLYLQKEKENRLLLGLTCFFVFVAISRIFYVIFDFILTDFLYWRIASAFILIGFGFFLLVAEYNLFQGRDKYLFSISYAVLAVVIVAIPDFALAEQVATYGILFPLLFIPVSYIYITVTSTGQIRRKSLEILLGILCYVVGLLLLVQFIISGLASAFAADPTEFLYIMHIISVGFRATGGVFLYIGFR